MANPRVSQHIMTLPVVGGRSLRDACQFERWRHIDPHLATPMVSVGGRNFYTFEPIKLRSQEVCVPMRWFIRVNPDGSHSICADAWRVETLVTDNTAGYLVKEYDVFEISENDLGLTFEDFCTTHAQLGQIDPRNILGKYVLDM